MGESCRGYTGLEDNDLASRKAGREVDIPSRKYRSSA
jgi:hypothetical protein